MRKAFLENLVDPISGAPLSLHVESEAEGHVERGTLSSADGRQWPILRGIPRFVDRELYAEADAPDSNDAAATARSFGTKWREARSQEYGSTEADRRSMHEVMLHMFHASGDAELDAMLRGAKAILNAGCGVAWPEYLYNPSESTRRFAVDLSLSVETAAQRTRALPNVCVAQADIFHLPFLPGSFDIIFSGGVVHHTPDPAGAVKALCALVRPGGLLGFYIYNVKPRMRELADAELRKITTKMSYEECRELSRQLALLGRSLQAFKEPLKIEEDVPLLGIRKGEYNLQKFLYDHFLKCFWNEGQGMDMSILTNLDWYHPAYASHHTKEEVFGWLEDAGMTGMKCTNPPGWEYSSNFISARRK